MGDQVIPVPEYGEEDLFVYDMEQIINQSDLDWIARNVHEWKRGASTVCIMGCHPSPMVMWNPIGRDTPFIFTEQQWRDRRDELEAEERMEIIMRNGNDGLHYDGDVGDEQHHVSNCKEIPDISNHSVEAADMVGQKFDAEKPRFDLIPPMAELQMAHVLTFGAKKYAPGNWQHVEDAETRYIAAALRHINAYRAGERRDDETGLPHLAHAMCCLAFVLELDERAEMERAV